MPALSRFLGACSLTTGLVLGLFTAHPAAANAPDSEAANEANYLLVHFTSEVQDGEQIYFAASRDGYRFTDLNGSRPVLTSTVGEKGVRDPAIIRSNDGKKFYILATDLRMANGKGWDVAMHRGSTPIVIRESTDLVNWSAPRRVDIAGNIPQAGCA